VELSNTLNHETDVNTECSLLSNEKDVLLKYDSARLINITERMHVQKFKIKGFIDWH